MITTSRTPRKKDIDIRPFSISHTRRGGKTSNINSVSYGKPKIGGAISIGAIGATLPKDAKTSLDENLKSLGHISEDGLVNGSPPDPEKTKAWGGNTVLVVASEKPDIFESKLIETLDIDVLKTVYGEENANGDLETGITTKANAAQAESYSYVVDTVLRGGVLKRIVIPNGAVSELGDIEYVDDDAVGFEITLEALPGRDGNNHYKYIMKSGE